MTTYSQQSKRRKHRHETPSSPLVLLSNVKSKKHDFALEINSESRSNQNTDASSSWSQHDLTQTNEQINLFGNWKIGIKSCLISNSLSSWPKNSEVQSTSFVKLAVKFEGKKSRTIGIAYLQNRIYSKDVAVSQINRHISQLWLKICHPSNRGTNVVGSTFSLTLFSFYLDKLTNSVHMLSLGSEYFDTVKQTWSNFKDVFQTFNKNPSEKLERIEVFISNELNDFLGEFRAPKSVFTIDPKTTDHRTFDENGIALDTRCAVFPWNKYEIMRAIINIPNTRKTSHIQPSSIAVYTNVPIAHSRIKSYEGNVYHYIDQIPVKDINKNSTSLIQFFPEKIAYKSILQNIQMDRIDVLLTNAETNKPINLDGNFVLTLDFKLVNS